MSGPSRKSSDSSDNPVPWVSPPSVRGGPSGYRTVIVLGGIIGMIALPYGFWTFLLGFATVGAMAHQGIANKRAARERESARKRWDESN
jgi:hypothetical protein